MEGNRNQTNDTIRVFRALKDNIMKSTSVCSICKVTNNNGQNVQEPYIEVVSSVEYWFANGYNLGIQVVRVNGSIIDKPYVKDGEWWYQSSSTHIAIADTSLYRTCQFINKPSVYIDCFDVSGETIANDDYVVVLFTDEDTRENLTRIKRGEETIEINEEKVKHNLNYGIIIKKINLSSEGE